MYLWHSKVCKTSLVQVVHYTLPLFLFQLAACTAAPLVHSVSRGDVSIVS